MKKGTAGRNARGESGAALVTVLLVSALLLGAGAAALVATGSALRDANDAAAERQAYYAAEAGLETALSALRGNLAPDGLPPLARISLRSAVTPALSNGAARTSSTAPCGSAATEDSLCRLAAYVPYNDRASSEGSAPAGAGGRFRVRLHDPDDSHRVEFEASGAWRAASVPPALPVSVSGGTVRIGLPPTQTVITYAPWSGAIDDATRTGMGAETAPLGRFIVTSGAAHPTLPPGAEVAVFDLRVRQTRPWAAEHAVRAVLRVRDTPSPCANTSFELRFERAGFSAGGTSFALRDLTAGRLPLLSCPAGVTEPRAAVVAPAPRRLVVRSRGYGPKWAEKRLEMVVDRVALDPEFPAAVTLRGADDCSPPLIDTGSAGAKVYTGRDRDGFEGLKPAFAVTACDADDAAAGIRKHETVEDPEVGVLGTAAAPEPSYLRSADEARRLLAELEAEARAQGRYFRPAAGQARAVTNADGTIARPGFTFVDGDCDLDTAPGAGGLLVVTGNLQMEGTPTFDGVVLVLGGGTVNRDGGGSGIFSGALVVARFARTWPASENGQPHPFLAPTFNTNGGGNSTIQNSSAAIANSLSVLGGPRFKGFLEF